METARYKSPLAIYVYWCKEFTPGTDMARAIYRAFCRDSEEVESRGLGIVVRFRNAVGIPDEVDVERVLRVFVIDGKMVNSAEWAGELARIFTQAPVAGSVVPVLVTDAPVGELSKPLASLNAISLRRVAPEHWSDELVRCLQHELVRTLVGRARDGLSPAPVRLFVSHAKRDGRDIATHLKEYVLRHTELHTFFDANDIAPGHKFELEIFNSIEHSALVVVRTDAYASREWCRREVIEAKRRSRPIVVIDALTKGEERGFPYLGNVPAVRWDAAVSHDEMCRDALDLALREVLRCIYSLEQWRALKGLVFPIAGRDAHAIPRPPELLLPASPSAGEPTILVYPDPPVGDEEAEVLVAHRPEVSAVTPLLLAWGGSGVRAPLRDRSVAISVSEPEEEDLQRRGLAPEHVDEVAIEMARYMLASGARLRYGGDLRRAGFTEKLVALVERHNAVSGDPFLRIENYLAWHVHLAAGEPSRDAGCKNVPIARPGDLELAGSAPHATDEYIRARCLTAMREAMSVGLHARVIVGGRMRGYAGRVPGIIEEAMLALRCHVPLYVVGGFGGAAALVANVIAGKDLESALSALDGGSEREGLAAAYTAAGIADTCAPREALGPFAGMDTATLRNGLSDNDNRILMSTVHVPEILFLLLRGLRTVYAATVMPSD